MTACAHIFRSLIKCFQISLLLLLHLDTLHNMVKLGFHYLFPLVFCHIMHIYIASSCAEFDTCPKHCDTTKFVKFIVYFVVHFTYMFLHMSVTTHTCNFSLQLYVAALAYVRVGSLWFCHFSYVVLQWGVFVHIKFQCTHFFHSFPACETCNKGFFANIIVTLVTYDVLLIISFIWHTIVFCPYFVLSKVRNLSVGTVLQWIHFCCGSLQVNLTANVMHHYSLAWFFPINLYHISCRCIPWM